MGRDPSKRGKESFNHGAGTAGDPHGLIPHHTQKLTRTGPERDFPGHPVVKNPPCSERCRGSAPATTIPHAGGHYASPRDHDPTCRGHYVRPATTIPHAVDTTSAPATTIPHAVDTTPTHHSWRAVPAPQLRPKAAINKQTNLKIRPQTQI